VISATSCSCDMQCLGLISKQPFSCSHEEELFFSLQGPCLHSVHKDWQGHYAVDFDVVSYWSPVVSLTGHKLMMNYHLARTCTYYLVT